MAEDRDHALGGRPIDMSRPILKNQDGSFSTEETITIEMNGKHFVIPTIVNGKRVGEEAAVTMFKQGINKPVGVFDNADDAEDYAVKRSQEIGKRRGGERSDAQDAFDGGFQQARGEPLFNGTDRNYGKRPDVAREPNRSEALNERRRPDPVIPNVYKGPLVKPDSEDHPQPAATPQIRT